MCRLIHRFTCPKDMLSGGKTCELPVQGTLPFPGANDDGTLMHFPCPDFVIVGYVDHPAVILTGRCSDNLILVQYQIGFALQDKVNVLLCGHISRCKSAARGKDGVIIRCGFSFLNAVAVFE